MSQDEKAALAYGQRYNLAYQYVNYETKQTIFYKFAGFHSTRFEEEESDEEESILFDLFGDAKTTKKEPKKKSQYKEVFISLKVISEFAKEMDKAPVNNNAACLAK
jgi:hypothetical protein